MTIHQKLRQLRIDAGVTQDELGEWMGVQRKAVSQWETGRHGDMNLSTLRRYCRVFRMSLSELLEGVQ